MAINLSPEKLVYKYIKSATKGKAISLKSLRILTLIIVPIWILGVVFATTSSVEAFKGFKKYREIQNIKKNGYAHDNDDNNCYGGHIHEAWRYDGESIHQCSCFDINFWVDKGLTNPVHTDSVIVLISIAEGIQLASIGQIMNIIYLFLLLVLAPWLIIRIINWINDANKVVVESERPSQQEKSQL